MPEPAITTEKPDWQFLRGNWVPDTMNHYPDSFFPTGMTVTETTTTIGKKTIIEGGEWVKGPTKVHQNVVIDFDIDVPAPSAGRTEVTP